MEAIQKIKDAEDRGAEIVKKATEESKEIIKKAQLQGETQKKEILNEAFKQKVKLIETARMEATKECEPLIAHGEDELQKTKSPDSQKLADTISLVIERIVNVNGNR